MLTTEQSRALNDRVPSAAISVDNCITCRGSKKFRWWNTERTEVVEYDCNCADQYLLFRWLSHCGISPAYMRLGWADLVNPPERVVQAVLDYVENRDAYLSRGIGLIFTGTRGTGKTLLGNLLLKDLIGLGVDAYVTSFSDMIDTYAKGWRSDDKSKWFDHRVRNAGALLIDDLGRERNKGPESVGDNMLETVIRHRVGFQQPVFVTTNLSQEQIFSGYGGHTMSLLAESAMFIEVPGQDIRSDIQARTMNEIRNGIRQRPVVIG